MCLGNTTAIQWAISCTVPAVASASSGTLALYCGELFSQEPRLQAAKASPARTFCCSAAGKPAWSVFTKHLIHSQQGRIKPWVSQPFLADISLHHVAASLCILSILSSSWEIVMCSEPFSRARCLFKQHKNHSIVPLLYNYLHIESSTWNNA